MQGAVGEVFDDFGGVEEGTAGGAVVSVVCAYGGEAVGVGVSYVVVAWCNSSDL